MKQERVIDEILRERQAQERKWGPQSHEDGWWMLILQEEVGEAARIAMRLGSKGVARGVAEMDAQAASLGDLQRELVQAAAVIVAWLEDLP